MSGLHDRSSRPHRSPAQTPAALAEQIAALRRQRRTGGEIATTIGISKAFRKACADQGLKHVRTGPYTPKTNGKAERFIQTALREWAYAQAYGNSAHRAEELPHWLHGYNWQQAHGSLKAQTPISRLGLTGDNVLRLHSAILGHRPESKMTEQYYQQIDDRTGCANRLNLRDLSSRGIAQ